MILQHYIGASIILLLITLVGFYSGRKVKSAKDFSSGGRQAGAGVVLGAIMGTLVGGASTIGTAQLAFTFGFSAWWFTLGGGIACLVLALVYATSLYSSGITTMPQLLSREYGQTAATTATVLTSLGSLLSIVSQVLAGIALVTSVSSLSSFSATVITVLLMFVYVIFGGVWGAGYVGLVKILLMYVGVGACGILACMGMDGVALGEVLPASRYFSLFARGVSVDLGAGLSLVLGVVTTQAYIQALISARTFQQARLGVLLGAVLIPIIGLGGIAVGLFMKLNHPEIVPGSALPLFIMEYMHPLFAGMILATLLVAVVGTGAGVALGLSSMICNDIYKVYINTAPTDTRLLGVSRGTLGGILLLAAAVSFGNVSSLILDWSFMSMGLRGAVAFGAMTAAIFLPGRIPARYALASMVVGPLSILVAKPLLPASVDPLFAGVACCLLVLALGYFVRARQAAQNS